MTTATYLALATVEEVLTTTDLLSAGFREIVALGRQTISYTPHQQPLSLDHPVLAFADKQPANDNEQEETAEPQPAPALQPSAAMIIFMQKLLNSGSTLWAPIAADWLAHRSEAGATYRGQRIFDQAAVMLPNFVARLDRRLIAAIKPSAGRANLKTMHSSLPPSISLASRPFLENQPKPGNRAKNNLDLNVAI